jgi:hypothetical protein
MLAEIGAGLGSLKAMKDIVQTLNSVRNEVAVNSVKIELQAHILDVQQALLAAQEAGAATARRIAELEQEIVGFKDWRGEAERYQLQDVGRGATVYALKLGMENGEPPHWLCANCFNQRRKSLLQFKGQDKRPGGGNAETSNYACDACRSSFKVHYTIKPASFIQRADV